MSLFTVDLMRKCFPSLNRTDHVFQSKLSIMSLHPHVAEPETAFSMQCTVHVRKCSLAVVAATLRLITLTLSVLLLLKCGFVSREAVSFFVTRHRSCSDAKFCCVCHAVHVMLSFMSCRACLVIVAGVRRGCDAQQHLPVQHPQRPTRLLLHRLYYW